MTEMERLQTLSMEGDFSEGFYIDSFNSWDDEDSSDYNEEEFLEIPSREIKQTVHILDRPNSEKVIYGGFLRHKFYQKIGGKDPFSGNAELSCRNCDTNLTDTSEEEELEYSSFLEVFYKEEDSNNRNLPELVIALLQLYDWVGICECEEIHFGYFQEKSLRSRLNALVTNAKNLVTENEKPISNNEDSPMEQMNLFDFIEEPV